MLIRQRKLCAVANYWYFWIV